MEVLDELEMTYDRLGMEQDMSMDASSIRE